MFVMISSVCDIVNCRVTNLLFSDADKYVLTIFQASVC